MKKISPRKNYDYRKGRKVIFETESRTKQAFKDECDINLIVRRAEKAGGFLPEMVRANPRYGDFADAPTYQEAMNVVAHAQEQFAALPAAVRAAFRNDPENFLKFASDPKNAPGLVELGLATARQKGPAHEEELAKDLKALRELVSKPPGQPTPPSSKKDKSTQASDE